MRLPKHPTLRRRMLDSRVKQCQPQGPLLAATLVACPASDAVAKKAVPAREDNAIAPSNSPSKNKANRDPLTIMEE